MVGGVGGGVKSFFCQPQLRLSCGWVGVLTIYFMGEGGHQMFVFYKFNNLVRPSF